ncbi:flagellar assembly protein H [Pseudomonas seleniipraecipitans]|jgi:flagellar assembly protein FliH|uniref:Flagellar assembly protein FliH n=1 Tax=Phytopseudomonas seleniipraecipitans TaxID=640205 RepID=A0ABY5JA40_9GAMM|nr:flagellar assembly protein FliH [Pseudomonas seleniipraecipitans]UUD64921.1 flagellar assembly protein H [Pseudomonas seleniipraecipitans]
MSVKVIRETDKAWRAYRFPPRCPDVLEPGSDAASVQRAMSDGFQQGIEKGYQEGLQQGHDAGHLQGLEQGREEGLRQGREEGLVHGQSVFEEAARPLDAVCEQLRLQAAEQEKRRRQELLELVGKVARQVIRCELTLNPTQLLTLAEEALAGMPGEQGEVKVLLNPEEYARLRDLAPERAVNWRLVADERLALGECRVVTEQAEADIGCQQRLDSCLETLSEHLELSEG